MCTSRRCQTLGDAVASLLGMGAWLTPSKQTKPCVIVPNFDALGQTVYAYVPTNLGDAGAHTFGMGMWLTQ